MFNDTGSTLPHNNEMGYTVSFKFSACTVVSLKYAPMYRKVIILKKGFRNFVVCENTLKDKA